MDKKILMFIIVLFIMPFPMTAICGSLPDTGQTKCYDDSGTTITCPGPGQPFAGQDACYDISTPSYTKLGINATILEDTASSWIMVRDNVTGLIWEVKTDQDNIADLTNPTDADNKYTWYSSDAEINLGFPGTDGDRTDTEDYIQALNDMSFGGFNDWRLPTRNELESIVIYHRSLPIDTNFFPNTKNNSYWSSTTHAHSLGNAWYISFSGGLFYNGYKSSNIYVRAVRTGQ